jgi:hypothetical protein
MTTNHNPIFGTVLQFYYNFLPFMYDEATLRQNLQQVILQSMSPVDSDQEHPLTWLKIKTTNYINLIPSSRYWASL